METQGPMESKEHRCVPAGVLVYMFVNLLPTSIHSTSYTTHTHHTHTHAHTQHPPPPPPPPPHTHTLMYAHSHSHANRGHLDHQGPRGKLDSQESL